MRFVAFVVALGLGLAVTTAQASVPTKDKPKDTCGKFGTSVSFLESPAEAATQAAKQEKLVLVLHVSGIFEDPRFT
jgi:hypothetical protein